MCLPFFNNAAVPSQTSTDAHMHTDISFFLLFLIPIRDFPLSSCLIYFLQENQAFLEAAYIQKSPQVLESLGPENIVLPAIASISCSFVAFFLFFFFWLPIARCGWMARRCRRD